MPQTWSSLNVGVQPPIASQTHLTYRAESLTEKVFSPVAFTPVPPATGVQAIPFAE